MRDAEYLLKGLLAVIHRDDGETTEAHGLEESVNLARRRIEVERLRRENAESRWERFHGMTTDRVGF